MLRHPPLGHTASSVMLPLTQITASHSTVRKLYCFKQDKNPETHVNTIYNSVCPRGVPGASRRRSEGARPIPGTVLHLDHLTRKGVLQTCRLTGQAQSSWNRSPSAQGIVDAPEAPTLPSEHIRARPIRGKRTGRSSLEKGPGSLGNGPPPGGLQEKLGS